eukprot:CAMPEP_0168490444 /NCGR_PEP_ID=MMETSP0228-20121227/69189_1 /TAXON_ID=133427 /ORGANISM="Protoceratium reticulatum, Strain CCCM 535 (=CCMP 1889)" /LENGTH=48 /DNA_ID= /DNA_START= /DNA_END= /DNA_ORIENTATION=
MEFEPAPGRKPRLQRVQSTRQINHALGVDNEMKAERSLAREEKRRPHS